ncbi:unnamed protein product, partial [Prunus brigantina]
LAAPPPQRRRQQHKDTSMAAAREEMELKVWGGLSLELRAGGIRWAFFFLFRPGPKRRRFGPGCLKKKKKRAPKQPPSSSAVLFLLLSAIPSTTWCASPRGRASSSEGHLRLLPWLPRGRATPLTPLWLRL